MHHLSVGCDVRYYLRLACDDVLIHFSVACDVMHHLGVRCSAMYQFSVGLISCIISVERNMDHLSVK